MTSRSWRHRIEDILEAIASIQSYTAGLTEQEFAASKLLTDAVERNFAVIGEAMVHVPEEVRARYPQIAWRQMRQMRNLVSHVYHAVDQHIVWSTIQQDLGPTSEQLRELLEQEPDDSAPA